VPVRLKPAMNAITSPDAASSVMQIATSAVNRAVAGMSGDAATVASAAIAQSGDLLTAIVDSRQQLLYAQAGAKMISAADQMLGTLIDIRA
jgi:hypothetical protein